MVIYRYPLELSHPSETKGGVFVQDINGLLEFADSRWMSIRGYMVDRGCSWGVFLDALGMSVHIQEYPRYWQNMDRLIRLLLSRLGLLARALILYVCDCHWSLVWLCRHRDRTGSAPEKRLVRDVLICNHRRTYEHDKIIQVWSISREQFSFEKVTVRLHTLCFSSAEMLRNKRKCMQLPGPQETLRNNLRLGVGAFLVWLAKQSK